MSRWTVFPMIFSAVLSALLADPGMAQVLPLSPPSTGTTENLPSAARPVAPLPHESHGPCALFGSIDQCAGSATVVVRGLQPWMSPGVPAPPRCAFDCAEGIVTFQNSFSCTPGFNFMVPVPGPFTVDATTPGHNPCDRFGEFLCDPHDGVRVVGFRVLGLPRTGEHYAYPVLGKNTVRCEDNTPGWWVESVRVPQPRNESAPNMLFFWSGEKPMTPREDHTSSCNTCCNSGSGHPAAICCTSSGKLSGTWCRTVNNYQVVVTFQNEELKVRFTQAEPDKTYGMTLTGHYTLTREGLVYGVVTSVDEEVKLTSSNSAEHDLIARSGLSLFLDQVVDCPFSFHVQSTSSGLMVSSFKTLPIERNLCESGTYTLCGLYQSVKEGSVPEAPKWDARFLQLEQGKVESAPDGAVTMNVTGGPISSTFDPTTVQQTARTSPDVVMPMIPPQLPGTIGEPMGITAPDPVPASATPTVRQGLSWSPLPAGNVPASAFDTMANALGQMVQERAGNATVCPSAPIVCPGGYPALPPHEYYGVPTQVNAAPAICGVPSCTNTPFTGLTGTWVREVGPALYVIQFERDQLTVSAGLAQQFPDGTVSSASLTMMAEYHMMADGKTLSGVITGVDVRLEGDFTGNGEVESLLQKVSQLQKDLTDQPLAMCARMSGTTLTIGNVRLPQSSEADSWAPMNALGGRYTQGYEKSLPKPRVIKLNVPAVPGPVPATIPPSGACLPASAICAPAAAIYSQTPGSTGSFTTSPPIPYITVQGGPDAPAYGLVPQTVPNPYGYGMTTVLVPTAYPSCPAPAASAGHQPTIELTVPTQMPETKPGGPLEPPVTERKTQKKLPAQIPVAPDRIEKTP